MVQKIINTYKVIQTIPVAIYKLYKAKKRADALYKAHPARYYVLASSPTALIVTSKIYQHRTGKKPIHINQRTHRTRPASVGAMHKDSYYFTPTSKGKVPANYKKLMRVKFLMYIKHQLFYIREASKAKPSSTSR